MAAKGEQNNDILHKYWDFFTTYSRDKANLDVHRLLGISPILFLEFPSRKENMREQEKIRNTYSLAYENFEQERTEKIGHLIWPSPIQPQRIYNSHYDNGAPAMFTS